MVRGWEAINGYNPLRIGMYDRLVSPGEQNWDVSQRQFPSSFANYDCPLAQALGLTYLVLGQPLQRLPGLTTPPASEQLLAGPPIWIYRIPGAMPRARMLGIQAEALRSDGLLTIEPSSAHALGATQTGTPLRAAPPSSENDSGIAKIESSVPGRVDVVTTSTSAAHLVLHDVYYPGWVAEIDGKPTPIVRAGMLFRAVEVPPGTHHIMFRFAPFSPGNLRAALKAVLGPPATDP
jgi:hypothetical protein